MKKILLSWFAAPLTALVVLTFALPAKASYDLQVSITGAGSIEFSPEGTSCGDGCYQYANWTMVTLTPLPEEGWSFDRWDGAGSGSSKRYIFMDSDKSVAAYFSQDPNTATRIQVSADQVINPDILGIGLNFATAFVPQDQSDRQAFFNLLKDSGVSWIRVVPQYYEWEKRSNDDSTPWTQPATFLANNFGGFDWNGDGRLFYGLQSLLDTCEANDIWLEFNNWEVALKDWLNPGYYSDPDSPPIPFSRFNADAQEFGENLAAMIYYLKTSARQGQGYSCVKFWAAWNEPGGGHPGQEFINFDYPGTMNFLYKQVVDHLKAYDQASGTDVMDEIASIGMESFPFFRNCPISGHAMDNWDEMVGRGVIQYLEPPDGLDGEITDWPDGDPTMDAISIHEYWSVFDYDANNPHDQNQGTIQHRLVDKLLHDTNQQIRQYDMDGQIEPVFIGELGSKPYKQNPPIFDQSLFILEGALRAFQVSGVKAVAKWSFNTHYEWTMVSYPGFDWETAPMGQVHPVAVNYFPFKLVASRLSRDSDVVSTTVTGGIDATAGPQTWSVVETQRVFATSTLSPDNRLSVFVVNDSYESKNVHVSISPAMSSSLDKAWISAASHDSISTASVDLGPASEFDDEIPPRSIVVYQGQYDTQQAHCQDDLTLWLPDGSTMDCSPYLCQDGACLSRCTQDDQCAPGFQCMNSICAEPHDDGESLDAHDGDSLDADANDITDDRADGADMPSDQGTGADEARPDGSDDNADDGGSPGQDAGFTDEDSAQGGCGCRSENTASGFSSSYLLVFLLLAYRRKKARQQ